MISQPLRRCSSVVSTLPRPILITVRPRNFVCVRYARPDALIRSTMSLLICRCLISGSRRALAAAVPGAARRAAAPTNRKQTTPMLGCADNSKRSSFLIQSASRFARRICSRRRATTPARPNERQITHALSARNLRPSWIP